MYTPEVCRRLLIKPIYAGIVSPLFSAHWPGTIILTPAQARIGAEEHECEDCSACSLIWSSRSRPSVGECEARAATCSSSPAERGGRGLHSAAQDDPGSRGTSRGGDAALMNILGQLPCAAEARRPGLTEA